MINAASADERCVVKMVASSRRKRETRVRLVGSGDPAGPNAASRTATTPERRKNLNANMWSPASRSDCSGVVSEHLNFPYPRRQSYNSVGALGAPPLLAALPSLFPPAFIIALLLHYATSDGPYREATLSALIVVSTLQGRLFSPSSVLSHWSRHCSGLK